MTSSFLGGILEKITCLPFSKRENLRQEGVLFARIMRADWETQVSVEFLPSVIKGAGGYGVLF